MKTNCLCLVLGLVLLLTGSSDAQPHAMDSVGRPVPCCFSFINFTIPVKQIEKIEKTPSSCPKPGFVVTTARRKKFCKQSVALLP
ncbi:C-C motif chemokine 8-like [Hoplias malabaricus]|uniref:C-C motif chemokine 8-like n=1 Tax=Hoplias malabaricus TaxID=27720 RepID=UPI003462E68E